MGRKIVLLSDGTGNSSAKVWRTNVWRVFERLDLSESDQVAFYDDGVGTAEFKPIALLGGAFGFGLKRNVIDLYKFACRNYRNDDDEIYGLGFSRGAFTIRTVIWLIADQGLVHAKSEPELHEKATQAYRAFRAAHFHTKWPRPLRPERWARSLRDIFIRKDYDRSSNRSRINIKFVGVWDTVAAYGMPVEEMTIGISNWVWPLMLPDHVLDRSVERACHALSIDDERTTFHPVLWDERQEDPLLADTNGCRYLHDERISQVWFAGAHANVGGGYPDDALAQIPLTWIMREAQRSGLRFKTDVIASPQTYDYPQTVQDKDGRIYDPRQGFGGYYRFGPRDIAALGRTMLSRGGRPAVPRIHASVFRRIANRAHAYTPVGIPADYEVVREHDSGYEVVSRDAAQFEHSEAAAARGNEQHRAWNIIWWRRGLYFLTVAVSLYLFAFPVLRDAAEQAEFTSRLAWVSQSLRFVQRFLPAAVEPWFDGYAREPGRFVFVAIFLYLLLLLSSRLAARTQVKMDLAWQRSLGHQIDDAGPPTDLLFRFRTSPAYVKAHHWLKWRFAPGLFAVLFVYLGLTFASHIAFNLQDYAGLICKEVGTKNELNAGEIVMERGTAKPLPRGNDKTTALAYFSSPQYVLPRFEPRQPCQNMHVRVQADRRYLITLESTETFKDWSGLTAPYGYYSTAIVSDPAEPLRGLPTSRRLGNIALLPLRRELRYPWFQVMARVGGTGGEDTLLKPDFTEPRFKMSVLFIPRRDGELFLFVNSPVLALPGLRNIFYRRNEGSTRVLIAQCGGGTTALC